MKSKKIVAGLVSAAFLSLSFVAPVAAAPVLTPIKALIPIEELQPHYQGFTGVVKKIDLHGNVADGKILFIEDNMGGPAHIIVAEDTYIVDNAEIAVGDEIIYFYDISLPMIMIYPPQIKADVIALKNSERNIKVDIFDKDLVSLDNTLKLNITEQTEVIFRDGSTYKGSLANQKLIVIYDISTKSIPAQTSPKKVIVLDEVADNDKDLYDENYRPDVSKM
ncbi:MAG: copper amine oxidase N-terminal domain-containing protein, partial [Syntrophomonadaceae bacterium]|nr:copper amine oxidase N-terminal domain-containing protein [Syntrophomonadaceae bacterium]